MFCIGMAVQRRPPSRLLICRSMAEKKNQTSGYGRTPRPYPSSTPQNLGYGRTPECGVRPCPELEAPEQWGYGRTPPPEPFAGGTAVWVRSSGTATRCGRRPSVRGGTAVTHFWQCTVNSPSRFRSRTLDVGDLSQSRWVHLVISPAAGSASTCAAASAILHHFGWSLSSHFKCCGVVRLLTLQRDVPGSQPAEPSGDRCAAARQ